MFVRSTFASSADASFYHWETCPHTHSEAWNLGFDSCVRSLRLGGSALQQLVCMSFVRIFLQTICILDAGISLLLACIMATHAYSTLFEVAVLQDQETVCGSFGFVALLTCVSNVRWSVQPFKVRAVRYCNCLICSKHWSRAEYKVWYLCARCEVLATWIGEFFLFLVSSCLLMVDERIDTWEPL